MLPNTLSMDVVLKKITRIAFVGCVYLKNGYEKCQNIAKHSPKKEKHLKLFIEFNNF
jgi:hypothetical protein